MTTRQRILLEIAQYLAIGAGILVASSGRLVLWAAIVPLGLLGPFWLISFLQWRRRRRAQGRTDAHGAT